LLQVHGVRSKAGAVKARGASAASQNTGRRFGEAGGDGELPEEVVRDLGLAMSSGSGALVQVRQILRWRARSAGAGGGFIVQFYLINQYSS
jgi:hypothetical protein